MLLGDCNIKHALRTKELVVEGMKGGSVGPASIDLMLSPYFWRLQDNPLSLQASINPKKDQSEVGEAVTVPAGESFLLAGREFCLASCVERFAFASTLAGRLEGKSSLGRLGLMVHTTAGFFDPGFEGYPTLELYNVRTRPIILYPGMPIAQMSIFQLKVPTSIPYSGKYANQGPKPAPSQYHRNFD